MATEISKVFSFSKCCYAQFLTSLRSVSHREFRLIGPVSALNRAKHRITWFGTDCVQFWIILLSFPVTILTALHFLQRFRPCWLCLSQIVKKKCAFMVFLWFARWLDLGWDPLDLWIFVFSVSCIYEAQQTQSQCGFQGMSKPEPTEVRKKNTRPHLGMSGLVWL